MTTRSFLSVRRSLALAAVALLGAAACSGGSEEAAITAPVETTASEATTTTAGEATTTTAVEATTTTVAPHRVHGCGGCSVCSRGCVPVAALVDTTFLPDGLR